MEYWWSVQKQEEIQVLGGNPIPTSVYQPCYVCIAVLHTLVTGLLARSQYPEGPATGHLGTGFSWFPCV